MKRGKYTMTITRIKNGREETYTGYAYPNNGSTWTGRINQVSKGGRWKFISRAGYGSREKAEAYVVRWLEKLKASGDAAPNATKEKT